MVSIFAQRSDAQQATAVSDPLPYSRGFLVTGDYAIAGVDFTSQANPIVNGLSTGTLTVRGVPDDADIVAAYLYWEEIFTASPGMIPSAGVQFRDQPISPTAIKASSFKLSTNPATCWGAAGTSGATVADFRADVLYLLPKRFDSNNQWTGKYYANGPHHVTLPEINGNKAVQAAGATLVVVYRTFSGPLKKILIYDGAFPNTLPFAEGATLTQRLRGFYKSVASTPDKPSTYGTLSYIAGTGGNNQTEQIQFNNTVTNTIVSSTDPFPQTSPSSDRSWANPTYIGLTMTGSGGAAPFGETATTTLTSSASPAACRNIAAIIFSTPVADVDGDGLPDGIEDASKQLSDPPTIASPNGTPLPYLNKMGASSSHKDLFIEVNAMKAPGGTSYGSATAPYSSSVTTLTDAVGHNHMPTPDVLKMVGDVYAAQGITTHFDVGDIANYQNMYPCNTSLHPECDASAYLVPSAYARGGEQITEQACKSTDTNKVNCEFPDFPGTVGWKIGLQLYRDAPVADDGTEISVAKAQATWSTGQHRRRFDPNRADYFHYVLYAHARGKPKSGLPCLNAGAPAPYDSSGTCGSSSGLTDNPAYHVPLSTSGVADLPGSDVLITLGLWENFVGTKFVQASTTLHELGHNLNLWHGGVAAIWGDQNSPTYIEPNCKPNYLSSMNYLFQVHGLFDDAGKLHLDYSGGDQGALDETGLADLPFSPAPAYVPAWFAPAKSPLAVKLGVSAASRFCNGASFGTTNPDEARVYAASTTDPIDWNGDLIANSTAQQNVNLDGTADGVGIITTNLKAFNDWANIRLDQISSGRNEVKYSDGDFLDVGSGDFLDIGSGDFLDIGSGDFIDFGSGDFMDVGSGDFLDFGSGDFLDVGSGDAQLGDFIDIGSGDFMDIGSGDFLDVGSGDFLDVGSGDFMDVGSGSSQELDFDRARAIGRAAAYGVNGCVINASGCITVPNSDPTANHVLLRWTPPPFGVVGQYMIFRKDGDASSTSLYSQIGTTTATSFVDPTQLPVGKTFTYYVQTTFSDDPGAKSGTSNLAVVVIVKK